MVSNLLIKLDQSLATVERGLNVGGWIPVVSEVTGAFRIAMGKVEIIAAFFIGMCVYLETERADQALEVVGEYIAHGCENICRGFLEMIPLIGNFFCFVYDHETNHDGAPLRSRYPNERGVRGAAVV